MYGSAAVVGGAVLLGRTPAWRPTLRRPSSLGMQPADPSGFTLLQPGAALQGTNGAVSLYLPAASTAGTLLVATLVSTGTTAFAPPTGTNWQRAKEVVFSGGRLEQWYWANNPGGLYPKGAAVQFTAGETCLGGMAEFSPPANSVVHMLDTVGRNSGGTGQAVQVATAGVFAGSLGVFSQAEFFTGTATGKWTLPSQYHDIVDQDTEPNAWSHSFNGDLTFPGDAITGLPSASGGFSLTSGSIGWGATLCCYRAVSVAPIGVVGGEVTNCLDLDPTGMMLVVGGDVEGCWRSANYGDNWQPADYGGIVANTSDPVQTVMADSNQISFADIKWSLLEDRTVYACVGKTGSGYGAFLASADGGCTWAQRNSPTPQLQFYGNGTPPNPPRNPNVNQDADRTVNRLIAQDGKNGRLYLVTANKGVMLSEDLGVTWTSLFFNDGTAYPRCIIINPDNPDELWVGMWYAGDYSGVYYCSTATTDPTSWNPVPGFPDTIADLKVLGSYLYAACDGDGIYRYPLSGGTPASLNGAASGTTSEIGGGPGMNSIDTLINTKIDAPYSNWVSLDGYEDTTVSPNTHVIIAGCSGGQVWPDGTGTNPPPDPNFTNIVQLTIPVGGTSVTYQDLTGPNLNLNTATLPPFNDAWWQAKDDSNFQIWLGGNSSVNPHILINPNDYNSIYVAGAGGFFRSTDGGTSWDMAVTGMPMLGMHCFAIDNNPVGNNIPGTHFVHCGDDYTSLDVNGDPSGYTPGDIISTDPAKNIAGGQNLTGPHRESHAVAIDPYDSRVYLGLNYAYSQNNGGSVLWRVQSPGTPGNLSQWTDTLYAKAVAKALSIADPNNAPAVIGLIGGSTGTSQDVKRWAVAIAQSLPAQPAQQGQPAQPPHPGAPYYWDGSGWTVSTENDGFPLPGSGSQVGQHIPIVACNTPGLLYCFDRKQGIYSSTNYGLNWTQIYPKNYTGGWDGTTSDERTGWIAVSPGNDSELWLSADSGLYKLADTSKPSSIQAVGGGVFAGGAAGIAFGPNGALYAIALPGSPAPAPTVTTLEVTTTGGLNAADWSDFTSGDGSVGSYSPPAGQLGISSSGYMWVTGGEHFGFWTQVPVS